MSAGIALAVVGGNFPAHTDDNPRWLGERG